MDNGYEQDSSRIHNTVVKLHHPNLSFRPLKKYAQKPELDVVSQCHKRKNKREENKTILKMV